jgi:hypothetical protein
VSLTALLKRLNPKITGAVYTESTQRAHVVVTYKDKPTASVEVTGHNLREIAELALLETGKTK